MLNRQLVLLVAPSTPHSEQRELWHVFGFQLLSSLGSSVVMMPACFRVENLAVGARTGSLRQRKGKCMCLVFILSFFRV